MYSLKMQYASNMVYFDKQHCNVACWDPGFPDNNFPVWIEMSRSYRISYNDVQFVFTNITKADGSG